MKNFKKVVSLALAVAMVATLAACFTGCTAKEDWKTDANGLTELLIGGIGPLTGDCANYGTSVRNGAQIAIDEINAANPNGINGFKLTYQFEDSQGDPASATAAYGRLVDNGMKVSLGATLSGETASVVAAAKADGMLVLTPSGSSVAAIAGSDQAFRVCFSDPAQGTASADFIAENKIATKVAAFYASDNDYSVGLYDTFKAECAVKGIEIVATQTFTDSTSTDFSTQIAAIKSSGAELVFLPIYAAEAATFLSQAKGKLDGVKVFGCDGLDGLLTKIDDVNTANGVIMLTPFNADSTDAKVSGFVSQYKAKYNTTPDQFAADGYDAVYAIVEAIKQANLSATDKDNFNARIVAAMTKITVAGVTGSMTWDASGEPTKSPMAMVYQNGNLVAFGQ